MKRMILPLFGLSLLTLVISGAASATTVNLQNGWYAQVTNVENYEQYMFPDGWYPHGWGLGYEASHIGVDLQNPGVYRFNMTNGQVTVGRQDACLNFMPAMTARYWGVRFNWETYCTSGIAANYLHLEIWGHRWEDGTGAYSHDLLGVIPYGTGPMSGYADFWFGQAYNAYDLHLTVGPIVPEPSGLLLLACGISGFVGFALRRRR